MIIMNIAPLLFSTLVMFRWGQSKLYWNGYSAFMFMLSASNHGCISTYQQWISPCSTSSFDDISPNLEYLHLGSSQSHQILVTDQNNALLLPSLPELYHALLMLCSLSCGKSLWLKVFLYKSFHILPVVRVGRVFLPDLCCLKIPTLRMRWGCFIDLCLIFCSNRNEI